MAATSIESSRHNLTSDSSYQYRFRAILIPGWPSLSSPDFFHSLKARFPEIQLDERHHITQKYIVYRVEAEKFKAEADELETRHGWRCIEAEMGLEPCCLLGSVPQENEASDLEHRDYHVKTLRDMRAICMTRVSIFETGTRAQIVQLINMEMADEIRAKEMHDNDDILQGHLNELWRHLRHDWEKLLRLRLICCIVNSERSKQRDMDGIVEELGSMDIDNGQDGGSDGGLEEAMNSAFEEMQVESMLAKMRL